MDGQFAPFELLLFHTLKHKDDRLVISVATATSSLAYVGTRDGKLLVYEYQTGVDELYKCKGRKALQLASTDTPIDKIVAVPEFAAVLVLCGGQLHIMNMLSLEIYGLIPKDLGSTEATVRAIGQFMGVAGDNRVTNFCVQHPRDSFRVCCQVARGSLMFYDIASVKPSEQLTPFTTIPLSENQVGQQILWTKRLLFVGTSQEYLTFSVQSGQAQQLFTLESNARPQIVCTHEDVLLVSGRVGVFVDFAGRITRGSITWSAPPLSVAYHRPYVVALLIGDKFEIHNVHNQQLMQTVPSQRGIMSIAQGDLLLMARRDMIYTLRGAPIQHQLEHLIELNRFPDALALADAMWKDNPHNLRKFYARAGLIWFAQGQFQQAIPALCESSVDPREVIALFPDLSLPTGSSSFQREYNHQLPASVDLVEARKSLLEFLEATRRPDLPVPVLQWVDTVMVRLYAELKEQCIAPFLETSTHVILDEAEDCLRTKGNSQQLIKLYKSKHMISEALACIRQLDLTQIIQTGYDPLDDAIDLLVECDDSVVVRESLEWAMERDPDRAIRIATNPERKAELEREEILQLMEKYGKYYQIEYMDYLIFVRGIREEELHTAMGVYCIDLIQEANQAPVVSRGGRRRARPTTTVQTGVIAYDPAKLQTVEAHLIRLLQFSEDYNSATLLGRIQGDSNLLDPCIILYSRMGRHKEALDILVHKKQDFTAADAYCAEHSGSAESNLFFDLLRLYMNTGVSNAAEIPENAFHLMNTRGADFDPLEVLSILPDDIPLQRIEDFLCKSSQSVMTEKRMKQVEASLCRMERILVNSRLHQEHSKSIHVDRETKCAVCGAILGDSVFGHCPNGDLVHFKCLPSE